jgi:cell division protein FtsI/penicillin-binding protein 2
MSPDGLDVRLSLDLVLQARTDALMQGQRGAVVLLNAQSGEIFVMSSHPTFDPGQLNELGMQLNKDPDKPLINRAAQGLYPLGTLTQPFARAIAEQEGQSVTQVGLPTVYEAFGLTRTPSIRMPAAEPVLDAERQDLHVSPLQVALASAALSNHGSVPAPRIATAVNTPNDGWVVLPALGEPFEAVSAETADAIARSLTGEGRSYWSYVGEAESDESPVTWFIGGTPPNWQASPLVVAVVLEDDDVPLAEEIGAGLLTAAMNP